MPVITVLEIRVNPGRVIPEALGNKAGQIRVTIPEISVLVGQPLHLVTGLVNAADGTEQGNPVEPPAGSSTCICTLSKALVVYILLFTLHCFKNCIKGLFLGEVTLLAGKNFF